MSTLRHATLPTALGSGRPAMRLAEASGARGTGSLRRRITATALWAALLGNVAIIVWLWVHGGNVTDGPQRRATLLTSLARLTGLLGAYSRCSRCCCSRGSPGSSGWPASTGSPSGTAGTATPASSSCSRTSS